MFEFHFRMLLVSYVCVARCAHSIEWWRILWNDIINRLGIITCFPIFIYAYWMEHKKWQPEGMCFANGWYIHFVYRFLSLFLNWWIFFFLLGFSPSKSENRRQFYCSKYLRFTTLFCDLALFSFIAINGFGSNPSTFVQCLKHDNKYKYLGIDLI